MGKEIKFLYQADVNSGQTANKLYICAHPQNLKIMNSLFSVIYFFP